MRHPDLEPIVEPDRRIAIAGRSSDHYRPLHPDRAPVARSCTHHAFSWNLTSPFSKKPTIWLAAATPALLFASRVWAPIFFLVKITLFIYLSPTSSLISSAFFGATSLRQQKSGLSFNTSTNSPSCTTSWRAVLINVPPLGICESKALLIDSFVSGVKGTCRETYWCLKRSATESTGVAPISAIFSFGMYGS